MDEKSHQLKDEHALVSAIRNGDRGAWAKLYDAYAPLIYRRVLMVRLADPTAAEDALSETFRTAIERFEKYQDKEVGIYPWLCRIAHNKAMDMHRARAMSGRKITDLGRLLDPILGRVTRADELLELKVESKVMHQRLTDTLESLNPRYREAIELRFLQEKDRESCAAALDVKIGTFDVLLLRALRSLKKSWQLDEGQAAHG